MNDKETGMTVKLSVAFAFAVLACAAFCAADAEREFADAIASGRPLDAEAAFRRLFAEHREIDPIR